MIKEPIKDKNAELKAKFLEYYRELPVQKLAAGFCGRDEDTIIRWKNEDKGFAYAVAVAKSEWARTKALKVRNQEWLLERVLKEQFAPRNEITGPEGEELKGLVIVKDGR